MVKTITVRLTEPSISVTLPREMAERLHLERGQQLFLVELEEGVLLTPYDPTLEEAMNAYRRVAKQYRGALRELAR